METREDEFLLLSGIQHFAYCRRQWALIHIEQQWAENLRTVEGQIFHKKAHDADKVEKRGDLLITRNLHIKSEELRVTGACDVVEFHRTDEGIELATYEGLWRPCPIEYKKGAPKEYNADELQLCGQAICLEEMLLCQIPYGYLFYGETRRRVQVEFTDELRCRVREMLAEMHALWEKGYTPKAKVNKGCNACSLKDICLPEISRVRTVQKYIEDSFTAEKNAL